MNPRKRKRSRAGGTGVAIFWDFDNIRATTDQICLYADAIITYAKSIGIIKYLGSCAVWDSVNVQIKDILTSHGFILVQNPKIEPNAADNALADQLLSIYKQGAIISDFILLTNDRGFLYHMGVVHAQGSKVHLVTSQKVTAEEFLARAAVHLTIDDLMVRYKRQGKIICYADEEWKLKQSKSREEGYELWKQAIGILMPKVHSEIRRIIQGRLINPPEKPQEYKEREGLDKWGSIHQSSLLLPATAEFLSAEIGLPIEIMEDIIDDLLEQQKKKSTVKIDKKISCAYCNKSFKKIEDLHQHMASVHPDKVLINNNQSNSL